jgi:hypothetical protein
MRHSPEVTGVLAKAASGGLEHVPIIPVQNLVRTLTELGERGVLRVGLDSEAPADMAQTELRLPMVLVLGAEGKGLRQSTRDLRRSGADRPARRDPQPQRLQRRGHLPLCCPPATRSTLSTRKKHTAAQKTLFGFLRQNPLFCGQIRGIRAKRCLIATNV